MEINPNHPVTQAVSNHWHKIAAILMNKFGVTEVCITEADVDKLPRNMFVTVQELDDGLHVKMVGEAEAMSLARQHGGLPN